MAITLRQESQTGATTKGDSLTFSELDNNFIDLLTNKIQPLQVDADTGSVTVGEAQSNGVFKFIGGSNITTSVAQDSAGNAEVTINGAVLDTQVVGGTDITVSQPDSAGAFTVSYSGSAISNVVEDTTPQLGGALDAQTNNITNLGRNVILGARNVYAGFAGEIVPASADPNVTYQPQLEKAPVLDIQPADVSEIYNTSDLKVASI